ncbi:MAG: HRDC domain-containing protein [Desulfobacterales bacterium]|nr:HRDC domain-containing protein [Desulfobacterales bacterium]
MPEYKTSDIQHSELFEQLREWRTIKAEEKNVARFQILHQRVLIQIVVTLPVTSEALLSIKGIGKKTMENYGDEILAIVRAYYETHQLNKNRQ